MFRDIESGEILSLDDLKAEYTQLSAAGDVVVIVEVDNEEYTVCKVNIDYNN